MSAEISLNGPRAAFANWCGSCFLARAMTGCKRMGLYWNAPSRLPELSLAILTPVPCVESYQSLSFIVKPILIKEFLAALFQGKNNVSCHS